MPTNIKIYIDEYQYAADFIKEYPQLSPESLSEFWTRYYDGRHPRGAGSKFSERVFTSWINNMLSDIKPELTVQWPCQLEIGGIFKKIDLHIHTNHSEAIIEYKCNIDMIEKDLFKLMHVKDKAIKKLMLIWEYFDNSKNITNQDSSYLTMLKHFKLIHGIDYIYMPLRSRQDHPIATEEIQSNINTLATFLKGI